MDEAAAGKEVIIARIGKPVAKPMPLASPATTKSRVLDRFAGQLTVPTDFDAPLPGDVLDDFEER